MLFFLVGFSQLDIPSDMSLSLERFVVRYAQNGFWGEGQLQMIKEVMESLDRPRKGSFIARGVELPTYTVNPETS